MKKPIIVLMTLLTTLSALAGNETDTNKTYTNDSGCKVEVENRKNGVIYYVSQGNKNEVVGITNDLTKGTFAYCHDSVLRINSFKGNKGIGITMSCSEHKNDTAVTRGSVDIDIMDGELAKIAIDGQVKRRFFGWKQDTKIECLNLVKK